MGAVTLRVGDLDRVSAFYREAIGLEELGRGEDGHLALVAPGSERALVNLISDPAAPPRPRGTTGLFHLAILVPSRRDLGYALARIATAGRTLHGASDHLVSEALYLGDPEGNGIEIYRDRPRTEWRTDASGELEMATLPLDLESVTKEIEGAETLEPVPAETRIGHVHLNVSDIASSEAFYADGIGLDVTVRTYPGALFLSAGGYHHHLGCNTWAGPNAPAPPPGSRGMVGYEIEVGDRAELGAIAGRLEGQGRALESVSEGHIEAVDPSGNRVSVTV